MASNRSGSRSHAPEYGYEVGNVPLGHSNAQILIRNDILKRLENMVLKEAVGTRERACMRKRSCARVGTQAIQPDSRVSPPLPLHRVMTIKGSEVMGE